MMRRVVSVWLPTFATDWAKRRTQTAPRDVSAAEHPPRSGRIPSAVYAAGAGGLRLIAIDRLAADAGLTSGLTLAQAKAMVPVLLAFPADPAGERRALERLARWCLRYTPWTRPEEVSAHSIAGAGLWLDVTGCGHLFDGEQGLLEDLVRRLDQFGLGARAAIADTPGAAWAVARLAPGDKAIVVPTGTTSAALAPLPVAGLRLSAAIRGDLDRLGLRCIGEMLALPRGPLVARLGSEVTKRLDQALGLQDEPISPLQPAPAFRTRLDFAEPIGRTADITAALARLLADLCDQLGAAHLGARRLEYALFRTDGTVIATHIGTGSPERDPTHLSRLFAEKIERLDPGYGIETAMLSARLCDPLPPAQDALVAKKEQRQAPDEKMAAPCRARLLDRLANRLGDGSTVQLSLRARHLPERAFAEIPVTEIPRRKEAAEALTAEYRPHASRPIHLLTTPEPVEAIAPVPDRPPVLFRWRGRPHRIAYADGPERIAPEWWRFDPAELAAMPERTRDYYRVEDVEGQRFWLFREGYYRPDRPPHWYLHGFFA